MTGSILGFDKTVRMKAAYTTTDLYIWAQWADNSTTNDLNRRRWAFNGGAADALPIFSTAVTTRTPTQVVPPGWSSNLNDDKLGVMWDIVTAGVGASSAGGTLFATAGCAMTCHTPDDMYPDNGRTDLWHYKTSRSNPVGYVNDQFTSPVTAGRVNGRRPCRSRAARSPGTSYTRRSVYPATMRTARARARTWRTMA
jgi:hypothetical protein